MAERVLLHIGLMKSGTTFLQGRLDANRDLLAAQGFLFPGATWGAQIQAVTDVLGFGGSAARKPSDGAWEALLAEMSGHPGSAIVSMEFLAAAVPANIARLADELADVDLRVVVTVRDLGRAVPAMWQEGIKNGRTWTWPEYLRGVREGGPAGQHFWRQQAAGRIVQRWADAVGTQRATLVTVPPAGSPPELLWDRFCTVSGLDRADWRPPERANESLGAASTLALRSLNEQLTDLTPRRYRSLVKSPVGNGVLAARRGAEDRIGFVVPRWLRARAEQVSERLMATGVPVVGDLTDLVPRDVAGVDPSTVGDRDQLEAAVAALAGLVRAQDARRDRRQRSL